MLPLNPREIITIRAKWRALIANFVTHSLIAPFSRQSSSSIDGSSSTIHSRCLCSRISPWLPCQHTYNISTIQCWCEEQTRYDSAHDPGLCSNVDDFLSWTYQKIWCCCARIIAKLIFLESSHKVAFNTPMINLVVSFGRSLARCCTDKLGGLGAVNESNASVDDLVVRGPYWNQAATTGLGKFPCRCGQTKVFLCLLFLDAGHGDHDGERGLNWTCYCAKVLDRCL